MSKSMFIRWIVCVVAAGLLLLGQASPDSLWAQDSCAQYDQAIRNAMANCTVVGMNESCYGNYQIFPKYSGNDVGFNYLGALASVSAFTQLETNDPGVVVMVLQPAAAAFPVRLTLFGNAWAGTSAAPDSLTFGASGGALCEGMYSGMVAYTPSGQMTQFTVNGVRIELASTAVITRRTNLTVGAAGGGSSRIVFDSDRAGNWDIYSMDMMGGNVVQLTTGGGQEFSPHLSPDGSQIAFVVNSAPQGPTMGWSQDSEIYVMNSDGSNVRRLTNDLTADWSPRWSPDGRRIAFTSDRDGLDSIYVMNADGGNVVQLTYSYWDAAPAWSPDGQQIVFHRSYFAPEGLYVINADGSNIREFTYGLDKSDTDPSWSPDGSRIAFVSTVGDGYRHVYVVSVEGGMPYRVTTREGWAPVWTPDGQQIVYESWDGDDFELFIINADGSNERNLTDNQYQDGDPHVGYGGGVSVGGDVMTIANKEGTVQVNVAGQVYTLPVGDELHIELAAQRPTVIGQNSGSPLIGYAPLDTMQQSLSAVQISSPQPAVSFEVREPAPCSFDLVNTSQNATSFTWQLVNVYTNGVTDVIQQPDLSWKLSPGDRIRVTLTGSGPGGTATSSPQEISCPIE